MLLIFCFVLGTTNFAMHAAVADCGHPFVEDTKLYFGKHFGPIASYTIEYVMLTGTMLLVDAGSQWIALFYGAYTAFNGFATYLFLNRRI
jgi:hypothetical protein